MKKIIFLVSVISFILFTAYGFAKENSKNITKSVNIKTETESVNIKEKVSKNVENNIVAGPLKIKLDNPKNNKGNLIVWIFKNKDAFPVKPQKAYKTKIVALDSLKDNQIVIDSLKYDSYAISIVHDEDGNGEMNTNFLGMPKEGVGVSNNAKGSFGPPKFKDAKFDFTSDFNTISIKINY